MVARVVFLSACFFCLISLPTVAQNAAPLPANPTAPSAYAMPVGTGSAVPCNVLAGPAYTLPPEKLAKAVALARTRTFLYFATPVWTLLALWLLLTWHVPARFRDWAERCTPRRWLQGYIFLPLFLLLLTLIGLPVDLYGHHLSRAYGISVQSWGSWWGDWAKALLLTLVVGTLLLSLLQWLVRRSPKHWWSWAWLAALPVMAFAIFIAPLVIDPIFNKFGPLEEKDPALVAQLEQVAQRGGLHVPPERMYWMQASAKVTALNAYVTGIGASKRIVVWDTTLQKATPDEVLFIFGHEMGHYVLNHIYKGMAFAAGLLFVLLWLGDRSVRWLVLRRGGAWQVRSLDDWAALAVLWMVFVFLGFFAAPAINSFTRVQEHHADIYGQEVIQGIVPCPQRSAQQAFQILGELSLSDPHPSPFVEFWMYSHPSILRRATFAAQYCPWCPGQHPRYVK